MKTQLKSTLETICNEVFSMKDVVKAKEIAVKHLEQTGVKDKDKMIKEIKTFSNMTSLQRYVCNALLKFEGLGMNQLTKEKPETAQ